MIEVSEALREAITADTRRVKVRAVVKIIDPDLSIDNITAQQEAYSRPDQLQDEESDLYPLVTLEENRWMLNGEYEFVGEQPNDSQIGFVGSVLCNDSGDFSTPYSIDIDVSGISVLQAMSVSFPSEPENGVPSDFLVEISTSGGVAVTETVTGNTSNVVPIRGFTVNYPTGINIVITKWSLPNRRVRLTELIIGFYERWTGDDLTEVDIKQQGDFTGLAVPYGTCRLTMDNFDRRFEPRNKNGLFVSLEERQGITVELGADTDAKTEYVPIGTFYLYQNGWKTSINKPTMSWDLVDIIGLLQDRQYAPTSTLPTTLSGWVHELCKQLGSNFENNYSVDPNYADLPCTVNSVQDVNGVSCGSILIWICQATGTFARADAENGFLTVEPYWNQGVMLDLDNLENYPEMSANDDISLITFTLSDGTQIAYNGNSISSSKTASINNPFLHTVAQAKAVAEQIVSAHGGNKITTTGRGDFTSEIGDVATIQLDESEATTARVVQQDFSFQGGVLRGCKTNFLQASGAKLYDETIRFTSDGTWTCPQGVSYVRVALGQGGQGGYKGADGWCGPNNSGSGTLAGNGTDGADGSGGKIWYGTVAVVAGQSYSVHVGNGGAANGGVGGHSTFAAYTSENGEVFPNGYTDILNGDSYGRTGVEKPLAGSSDGGAGGKGGSAGYGHIKRLYWPDGRERGWDYIVDVPPTPGKNGVAGASGFCLLEYVRVE